MPRDARAQTVRTSRLARWLAALLLTAALSALFASAAPAAARCAKTYSYAGLVSSRTGYGVRATLTPLALPTVVSGHVAGWVGVGGVGAGPKGETEWIQVGYSGFAGGESKLYYEVTLPGRQPRYTEVDAHVAAGERHRVAVVETATRRNVWRVWVDGRAVSRGFYLPGSHGRWQPVATSESWNEGDGTCNGFAYRFSRIAVATRPGDAWRAFAVGYELEDPGYRVTRTDTGFVASGRA